MSQIRRILFLGTGTSGALPNITCLSKGISQIKRSQDCVCKNYFIHKNHPDVRKNTSLLIMINDNGVEKNILVDCGKTFRQSALEYFPLHNISRIDAVLLTHGHADAIMGLDDLREFTATNAIPIYCSKGTLKVVQQVFPYLVDTSKASGGGDVARLNFHQVADEEVDLIAQNTTNALPCINIFSLIIEFVPVHHGFNPDGTVLLCYGFKFNKVFAYLSDVVFIPQQAAHHLEHVNIMVLDALKQSPHKSHSSIHESINAFNKLNVGFGLFVGFSHWLGHLQSIEICKTINATPVQLDNGQLLIKNESFEVYSAVSYDELTDYNRDVIKYKIKNISNHSLTRNTNKHYAPAYDGLMIDFE